MRREEICLLRWTDVDCETATIPVLSSDCFEAKSGRSRQVPLYPPLRKILEALPRSIPYVVSANKAKPDSSVISHRWLDLQRVVNAKRPEAEKYQHLRLHDLRGSFCTELLRRMAPAVVQQIMGHADIQTTMRHYSHLTSTMAVDAARKINFD